MKAFVIRPAVDVFNGTGSLKPNAEYAIKMIAEMVAASLCVGGDENLHAIIWDGPTMVDTPPAIMKIPDSSTLASLIFKCLDPNGQIGGDIRSLTNCRLASFGQDGQAFLCLRHEDASPVTPDPTLVAVSEESEWLVTTDLFDGTWPPT